MGEKDSMKFWLGFCLGLLMSPIIVGCGNEEAGPIDSGGRNPRDILRNLEASYKFKNYEAYANLLADDFRFYPEPETREREQLPEYFDRLTDSLLTMRLLASDDLLDVKIALTFNPTPLYVPGKPGWLRLDVLDTFLEAEFPATDEFPQGLTLHVDGHVQQFYFRKGRSEEDTLVTSPTAEDYYIVEWHDKGAPSGAKGAQ
jgi:hypothetical protein